MAILKLGVTVVGIRGTLGGITFSANASGPYARAWARPPNPRTIAQNDVRTVLSQVATEWRGITDAQRTAWNTWAAATAPARTNSLGETILLTGYQWFIGMNSNLVAYGFAFNAPAPVLAEPAAPTITLWRVTDDNAPSTQINWTSGQFTGFNFYARIAMAPTEGATSFNRPNFFTFRKLSIGLGGTNVFGIMTTKYGALPLNRRWFLRLSKMNTEGLIGPSDTAEVVTTT